MEWAFGDCVLSEDLFQLQRAGRPIKLEPKVFHVFRFLIEHRERVVSKAEILDHVWPGEAISESVLPRSIAVIRRAVGDSRAKQRVIETVHGHGYRFVAEVEAPTDLPPESPPVDLPDLEVGSDFVGRTRVLARLDEAFEQVVAGRGHVALLVGEPGIGKTRTVEQQVERMTLRAQTCLGTCSSDLGAPSYWPFVQILRSLVGGLEDDALVAALGPGQADLLPLLPELAARLPDVGALTPLEGEQARFRFFDSLAGLLRRVAVPRPLVLVLEDLHWADPDSVRLLRFLISALRDSGVFVLGTSRDVELPRTHPLMELFAEISRAPNCDRIDLRGLEPDQIDTLLRRIAGREIGEELVETVVEMTEGNPFFVRELATLVADGNQFRSEASGQHAITLPKGIRDAVGLRLDAVSPACVTMLCQAAVIGRSFPGRLLREVLGETDDDPLELLGEALAAGLLKEGGTADSYAFSHALVRRTLYDGFELTDRIRAHGQVAAALERSHGGESPEHLPELAFHLFESAVGGDPIRAMEMSVRAAELARRQAAYDESVRHFERALEALELSDQAEPDRRCELLLAQAEARWDAGGREQSHELFRRAAGLARELDRPELLARAAVGMRSYGDNTRPDAETVLLLEEALTAIGDQFPTWRARILSRLTYCDPHTRSMETRLRLSREATALTLEANDPAVLFDVFVSRYWATLGPDSLAERVAIGEEAVAAGRRLNDTRLALLGHDTLVGAHLVLGEFEAVGDHVEAFSDLAIALRQPFFEFHGLLLQIVQAMNRGRFSDAEALLARAVQRGEGTVEEAEALSAGIRFWLRDMRGELTDPSDAEAILKAVGSRLLSSMATDQIVKASVLEVFLAGGQQTEARHLLHDLFKNDLDGLSRNENWLMTMSLVSSAAITLEEAEIAAHLYEQLLPYEPLMFVHDHLHVNRGSVAATLGALAGVMGRPDEAVERMRAAIAREETLGALPAALDTRILLIQHHERSGRTNAAAQELEIARQAAEQFGSRRIFRVFPPLEG